jgi:hypothetical protein
MVEWPAPTPPDRKVRRGRLTTLATRFLALLSALVLAALSPCAAVQDKSRSCPEPTETKDPKFEPGQVWHYQTRPHEGRSTITVLRIESLPNLGVLVHIRVDNIRLRNCTGGPEPDTLAHMPFSRGAIERSVSELVKKNNVPDFQAGYDEWRKDCGGVYTITVAQAVQVAEDTFRNGLGCSPEN